MDKVVEVQQQVKNNATDLQEYLRDLDSWSKQMETKDEQLKKAKRNQSKQTSSTNNKSEIPQKIIKEKSSPPKKTKKEVTNTDSKSTLRSPKPKDYSEWDKFDVDAACEEIEKSPSSEEEGYTSEEEELEHQKMVVEAVAEKERGNEWFKKGNYDKAIERYTRGKKLKS